MCIMWTVQDWLFWCLDVRRGVLKLEDSDSVSGGSSLSLESSPTTSPYQGHRHKALAVSASIGENNEQDEEHSL